MKKSLLIEVKNYVEENIGIFHQNRISSLDRLKLSKILKRKNPYLFKAKNLQTSEQIVKTFIDAHLSSNEETIFGNWLEGLAIFINAKVYGGRKSGIKNIDLEFDNNDTRYLVNIKSGPNWGNSSQVAKMVSDFETAKKTLRSSGSKLNITSINGCCYGKENKPDRGRYYKYCGQEFWEFISGEANLYTEIIDPLGHSAPIKNDEFMKLYSQKINKFTREFSLGFCSEQGSIDWEKLVKFNSSSNSH